MVAAFCLILPTCIGLALAIYVHAKKPLWSTGFYNKFPDAQRWIALLLIVTAGLSAFFIDIADISDIFKGDAQLNRKTMSNIVETLDIYGVTNQHQVALSNQIVNLVDSIQPSHDPGPAVLVALAAGVLVGGYLLLIAIDYAGGASLSATVTSLQAQVATLQKELKDLTASSDQERRNLRDEIGSLTHVIKQVETVVIHKYRRIAEGVSKLRKISPIDDNKRLELLKEALHPLLQFQAIVDCVHAFFADSKIGGLTLRVAIFTEQKDRLLPKVSTDGRNSNVILLTPEDQDFFRTDVTPPRSVAAHAFRQMDPIIIPDCSKDIRYVKLAGESGVRSVIAVALSFKQDEPIGVLVADANQVDFFKDTADGRRLLHQLCGQIAVRLHFENELDRLLSEV